MSEIMSGVDFDESPSKKYIVECPFIDPRDNEVSLDTCHGCYWNNGIVNNLDGIPIHVNCKYMRTGMNFVVQVMSDYHE